MGHTAEQIQAAGLIPAGLAMAKAPAAGKSAGMDAAAELDALQAAAEKRKAKKGQSVQVREMVQEAAEKIEEINGGTGAGTDDAAPKTKRCPKCGQDLPADLDHFYEDTRGKLNLSSWCKLCQRKKSRESKRDARAERQEDEAQTGPEVPDPEAAPAPAPEADPEAPECRRVVELDFTDYPEMLDLVEVVAKGQWRSKDQQIMAWVEQGLRDVPAKKRCKIDLNATPWWAQEETA